MKQKSIFQAALKSAIIPVTLALSLTATTAAQESRICSWGDQGNGTYINPILNADYSDPDVIRVGEKYYLVASDFHFLGMQILESEDMVNWHVLIQLYHRFDYPGWDENKHYAGGSWAPSIRYHDGKFWVFFCTPDEGLFMTNAEKAEGPWSPLHLVKAVEKWEDPCPFWDEDGQAYLGHSVHGAGPIILHKMSPDGRELLDDGKTIYTGPTAEGTKFMKKDGYYYLSIPEGGVGGGWQTILRAKKIYGPYEKKVVLEKGMSDINGPHQGAIVDTPDGQWWFYHFQRTDALGRVVHLQPMHWHDNWPVIGVDMDMNGIGEPVRVWTLPMQSHGVEKPQTSDDFEAGTLSPQWQWNQNADDNAWSLTEHRGSLTLHALVSADFRQARNTLTQKIMGYESEATVCIDFAHLAEGGRCGLVCMGSGSQVLGIMKKGGKLLLYRGSESVPARWSNPVDLTETEILPAKGTKVYLRLHLDATNKAFTLSYSFDNKKFTVHGDPFFVGFVCWKGARIGLYHYNTEEAAGYITVPWVKYEILK